MAITQTHNEIVLRPPPGTRFTIFGADVHLQFERGREREVCDALKEWIQKYVEPVAIAADMRAKAEANRVAFERSREGNRQIINGEEPAKSAFEIPSGFASGFAARVKAASTETLPPPNAVTSKVSDDEDEIACSKRFHCALCNIEHPCVLESGHGGSCTDRGVFHTATNSGPTAA